VNSKQTGRLERLEGLVGSTKEARREQERRARVRDAIEVLEEERSHWCTGCGTPPPDDLRSPIERARAEGDKEAIAEYDFLTALIEERRRSRGKTY